MLSTLSVFISRPLVVILNKILSVDETVCLLIIRSDVTVRECTRGLHTSECAKFKIQKIKHLFITIKVQMITISSVIPYISETNSTSNSLKKKPSREKKKRKKDMEKRRRRKKGKERVCASEREEEKGERKGKRENEMGKKMRKKRERMKEKEKEKKEEEEKEEEKIEKAIQEMYHPL